MGSIVKMNKAQQLYNLLKEDIMTGKYGSKGKLPSIRELAKEYELSNNTVNTVIAMLSNDGLVQIKEGNGTYVNQSREPAKARMIGVILTDFSFNMSLMDMLIIDVAQRVFAEHKDYYLSFANTNDQCNLFCDSLEHLLDMGAEGFLIVPPRSEPANDEERERMHRLLSKKPIVFFNRSIQNVKADMYSMNLASGLEQAFEYLITNGKTKIALFLHDTKKFLEEELLAYKKLHVSYGLQLVPEFLVPYETDKERLCEKLDEILPRVDAIIAPDGIMNSMWDKLETCGRKIPKELSLIGINDSMITRMMNPPLTSICFPVEKIGRDGAAKIIARVGGNDQSANVFKNIVPEFVVRAT